MDIHLHNHILWKELCDIKSSTKILSHPISSNKHVLYHSHHLFMKSIWHNQRVDHLGLKKRNKEFNSLAQVENVAENSDFYNVFLNSYLGLITHPKGGLFRYHVKRIWSFHNARIWFSVCHICEGFDSQLLIRMGKCRHHLISRDLIWIKVVVTVWNYLQTESVIILAIPFAFFINCIWFEILK